MIAPDDRGDPAKAWAEGWHTGERYGYWAERGGGEDIEDLAITANPYTEETK